MEHRGPCPTYAEAQSTVDRLSDDGFPVEHLDIVGSDLKQIERVTGRLTNQTAAAAGAASGAWFGLLVGLLLGIFSDGQWFGLLLVGLVIGAVWVPRSATSATPPTGGGATSPRPRPWSPPATTSWPATARPTPPGPRCARRASSPSSTRSRAAHPRDRRLAEALGVGEQLVHRA